MRVHLTQEPAVETMLRSISDHRVDSARRAQSGLVRVDPCLDVRVRERVKAEITAASSAGLDLCTMSGCMHARRVVQDRIDRYRDCHRVGVLTPDLDGSTRAPRGWL
jgi:hypothetical protein